MLIRQMELVDTDPLNNQVISFAVDLGFDNAYWDGQLSIDVAGDAKIHGI